VNEIEQLKAELKTAEAKEDALSDVLAKTWEYLEVVKAMHEEARKERSEVSEKVIKYMNEHSL